MSRGESERGSGPTPSGEFKRGSAAASGPGPDRGPGRTTDVGASFARLLGLLFLSAVVFALGVYVTEFYGEFGSDIDLKPFFLIYLLIGMVGLGGPTLAIALGAAMGEGFHDLLEGYEPDEPLGFFGYLVGFALFGWILLRFAPDPGDRRYQVLAAVAAAFIQALFEGVAFLFRSGFSFTEAVLSVSGNTVTHGVVLGAIPFLFLYPLVRDGWWLFPGPSGSETDA